MDKSKGKLAYEESVKESPLYYDGTPRPAWDDLPTVTKWVWNRTEESRWTPWRPNK